MGHIDLIDEEDSTSMNRSSKDVLLLSGCRETHGAELEVGKCFQQLSVVAHAPCLCPSRMYLTAA
jgi:hypothetical protein